MSCSPPLTGLRITVHVRFTIFFFFFNDTATTEIYTLSLHDALPISTRASCSRVSLRERCSLHAGRIIRDRKSTRLNSSHSQISYAVFCLKKKRRDSQCTDISEPLCLYRNVNHIHRVSAE